MHGVEAFGLSEPQEVNACTLGSSVLGLSSLDPFLVVDMIDMVLPLD